MLRPSVAQVPRPSVAQVPRQSVAQVPISSTGAQTAHQAGPGEMAMTRTDNYDVAHEFTIWKARHQPRPIFQSTRGTTKCSSRLIFCVTRDTTKCDSKHIIHSTRSATIVTRDTFCRGVMILQRCCANFRQVHRGKGWRGRL